MDLIEKIAFFEANGWLQEGFARIIKDGTTFYVWCLEAGTGMMRNIHSTQNKEAAFAVYLNVSGMITVDEALSFNHNRIVYDSVECRLTKVQEIAVQILRGDEMATDLALDILRE